MKPNVLKKISSVIILIIILIMLFPNNVVAGNCEVNIEEKCFSTRNQGYLRVSKQIVRNNTNFRVTTRRTDGGKYDICSIQPTTGYNFYLYDMGTRRFICAPSDGGSSARRVPNDKFCLFREVPIIEYFQYFELRAGANRLGGKQNFQFISASTTQKRNCKQAVMNLCRTSTSKEKRSRRKHKALRHLCQKTYGC